MRRADRRGFSATASQRRHLAAETVAVAPGRPDQFRRLRVALYLLAQPADLVVDRAVEQLRRPAAREIEELVAGQHHARTLEQHAEQAELAAGERHRHFPVVDQFAPAEIED